MTNDGVFHRFQWEDKNGLTWNVEFIGDSLAFSAYAKSVSVRERGEAHVQTPDTDDQNQPTARLDDVRVSNQTENRGLGSMLVREAIEECKRGGHKGIYGHLSEVDRDHFPKLEHFYKKLGFSVVIYSEDRPKHQSSWAGKIEMIFDNVRVEP